MKSRNPDSRSKLVAVIPTVRGRGAGQPTVAHGDMLFAWSSEFQAAFDQREPDDRR